MTSHSRFASEEVKRLLAAAGICDLDSAFRVGTSVGEEHERRATRHENKLVVKLDLNDRSGTTVYIKRQWRRGRWLPRLTDLRHRIGLQCSPIHEWRGLRILQKAGFHVSEPLAVFWKGAGFSTGAVVTRAVPPKYSMADLLYSGELEQMQPAQRASLISAATELVVRLHRARISWRSMKAKHFYPEHLGNDRWRIWLIDCEGVYRWPSRRDREHQWAVYLRSFRADAPWLREAFDSAYRVASAA